MKPRLRVLIVEDSEEDMLLLLRELGRHYEVVHHRVETPPAFDEAMRTPSWDLVISDFSMPAWQALDVLKALRSSGHDIPCIIVSGTIGEEVAVEALRSGANDFIVKGRLARLGPAISRELREAEERRQRHAAERALAQTRERMRFAMDAASVGTWESDLAAGTVVWSDVMERLHGLPPGGFAGTVDSFIAAIHKDDRDRARTFILRSVLTPSDARLNYRVTWVDGSIHWIQAIGRTLTNEAGHPTRAAGVALDITVQKHLEEQFRQAQKMESVGNLAGGVAHDFNNLLTIVAGYCQMLDERLSMDAAARQDVAEIRSAAEKATALTRQLLAFSRKQILEPQVIDLNGIVKGLETMLRRLIEENVRIEIQLSPDLPRVYVDPGQMEQVLLNLAVNARDAMPNGGVLTIETSAVTLDDAYAAMHVGVQPGEYVALVVSDTGSGISADVKLHLFEPFFTTKEKGRGTGLGLATVYGIVRQSRGHIWVYSEVGTGTTFKVYLPVTIARPRAETAAEPRSGQEPAGTETVLVVEDDLALQALDVRILQRYGYHVLVASNGEEARRVSTEHDGPIHVVLLDVVMPGDSGRTIGDWIHQQRPESKLIYMSGYTDNAIVHHGVLDPGTVFLQKPFTPRALAAKIREVLA